MAGRCLISGGSPEISISDQKMSKLLSALSTSTGLKLGPLENLIADLKVLIEWYLQNTSDETQQRIAKWCRDLQQASERLRDVVAEAPAEVFHFGVHVPDLRIQQRLIEELENQVFDARLDAGLYNVRNPSNRPPTKGGFRDHSRENQGKPSSDTATISPSFQGSIAIEPSRQSSTALGLDTWISHTTPKNSKRCSMSTSRLAVRLPIKSPATGRT
jgi:hypothetical protein